MSNINNKISPKYKNEQTNTQGEESTNQEFHIQLLQKLYYLLILLVSLKFLIKCFNFEDHYIKLKV